MECVQILKAHKAGDGKEKVYVVARRRHKSGLLTTVIPSFDSVKSPFDYPPVSPCQASCNRERQGIYSRNTACRESSEPTVVMVKVKMEE